MLRIATGSSSPDEAQAKFAIHPVRQAFKISSEEFS